MKRTVMVAVLNKRRGSAVKFQKVLTEFGCIVKTRLGIHDGVLDKCSDTGLIILEVVGENANRKKFAVALKKVPGIKLKVVELSM